MDTLLRMRAALATLPLYEERVEGMLSEWMSFMSHPLEQGVQRGTALQVDTQHTTWWVQNADSQILAERYWNFVSAIEIAAPVEQKLMQNALKQFEGDFATFLRMGDEREDTGWEIAGGPFSLKMAFGMVPKNPDSDPIRNWFAQADIDACTRFGRCIAANTYSYLHVQMPGNNVQDDLAYYVNLCETIGQTPLPQAILQAIAEENPDSLELSIWLASEGLLQMGLVLPQPSSKLQTLINLVLGPGRLDTLAAYEGSLGEKAEVQEVLIARNGLGLEAELRYAIQGA